MCVNDGTPVTTYVLQDVVHCTCHTALSQHMYMVRPPNVQCGSTIIHMCNATVYIVCNSAFELPYIQYVHTGYYQCICPHTYTDIRTYMQYVYCKYIHTSTHTCNSCSLPGCAYSLCTVSTICIYRYINIYIPM